jgi:glycosyltransferase involved in cell wall biosynthesis
MRRSVLVAIKGLGVGGAEKLISESARMWDRDRFDYQVAYVLPWKDQLVAEIEGLDVPVHCVGTSRGMTPVSWRRLRRLVADTGVDLVHAHLPAMGAVARMASPVPVVYTEHNVASSYRVPVRLINRLTYGRNRAVTAVSQAVADSVASYPGPDVRVVPNGVACAVTPAETAAARRDLGVDPGVPLVVHVGNIRPHKGHANLVDTVVELVRSVPDVLVVSIGGEKHDGDLARVRGLAATAGVADHLRFLGRRDDALGFVGAADVFANPSDHEGLPVAVLEAMALGRPVVATAVGGVPTIVRNDETGILVPPRDPRALAAGIARLIADPALAGELAEAGRKVVERDYGLEAMVRRLEGMYDDVLAGRPHGNPDYG